MLHWVAVSVRRESLKIFIFQVEIELGSEGKAAEAVRQKEAVHIGKHLHCHYQFHIPVNTDVHPGLGSGGRGE